MAKKKSKKGEKKEEAPEEKNEIDEYLDEKEVEEPPEEKEVSEDDSEDAKGRIVVSQRERDEIDAVVDAFWALVNATKRAPRILLFAGIFLTIMGASFAGWPQTAFDMEIEGKSGVWVLITETDYDMAKGDDGYYANF